MSNEQQIKEIQDALDVLERHGRRVLRGKDVSRGRAIGCAIYYQLGAQDCTMLAKEALEQWNAHLAVAAIDAIECGRGTVKRDGRLLTINLPEWWETPHSPKGKIQPK